MSEDPHSPTTAGPTPEDGSVATDAAQPAVEPTPVVPPSEATWKQPAGTALPPPDTAQQRPEILVGAAFAGGLLAALILKRLGRDD